MSAMTRISRGEHPHLKIRSGDTVVFSANPIPGNTIAVMNTIDRLMQGAKVVYGREFTYLVMAVRRPKVDDWSDAT